MTFDVKQLFSSSHDIVSQETCQCMILYKHILHVCNKITTDHNSMSAG
jgi:hypothetical protein